MDKFASVSVIVPHYNDLIGLSACLDALSVQEGIDRDSYEIVVCDNNSPIDFKKIARVVDGRARLVQTASRGAGPARNEAVKHAKGQKLAFTDSDCIPDKNWLASGVARLRQGLIVGGQMLVSVENERALSGAEAFERVFAFNNRRYMEQESFSVTANLFCEKACFEHVGPFRTQVSEDKEWCQRAVALGYSLQYEPSAIVSHPARRNWRSLVKKWARIDIETFNLAMEKSSGKKWLWLCRAWLLPISIAPHSVACLRSRSVTGFKARALAIATLIRLRLWRFKHYLELSRAQGRVE